MASLQFAKDSVILEAIKAVSENDRRTQALELGGSVSFMAKSVVLSTSLADALHNNTCLTSLNLSSCNLGDGAMSKLAQPLKHNRTLFELNLANNKLGRPGMITLAGALAVNKGLMTLNLEGHRINSEVIMLTTHAQCWDQPDHTHALLACLYTHCCL